jgi:hypothetical protein
MIRHQDQLHLEHQGSRYGGLRLRAAGEQGKGLGGTVAEWFGVPEKKVWL